MRGVALLLYLPWVACSIFDSQCCRTGLLADVYDPTSLVAVCRHTPICMSVCHHIASLAMQVLRSEGVVVTDRRGSYVRSGDELVEVQVEQGRITARMPSEPERRDLGLTEGVPLLVVTGADGSEQVHPADRTVIMVNMS